MGVFVMIDSSVPSERLLRFLRGVSHDPYFYLESPGSEEFAQEMISRLKDTMTVLTPELPEQDGFLRAYRDSIGQMGEQVVSQWWWASDIASKNRFTSPIPPLFERLFGISKALETIPKDSVLIVRNVPWVMFSTLSTIARERGFAVHILARWWVPLWEKGKAWIVSLPYVAWHILQTCYRLAVAQIVLRARWAKEIQVRTAPLYALKTFSYDQSLSDSGAYHDPFWGTLPQDPPRRTRLVVFSAVLGQYAPLLRKMKRCLDISIYPFEILLTPLDIVKAVVAALSSIRSTKGPVLFFTYDVRELIEHELSRRDRSIAISSLLHFFAIRRLVRITRVGYFLYTYENNPWERMCVLAIKQNSPQTIILGYQHTVIAPSAVNMFVSHFPQEQSLLPTNVLTTGPTTTEFLARFGDYSPGVLRTSCALRFETFTTSHPFSTGTDLVLLVALEGVMQAREMAEYVLQQLRGTSYRILLRAHPALPLSSLHIPENMLSSAQVRISSGRSLRDDLLQSDRLIYWGSAVSLEAIVHGIPIIHYSTGALLEYDPLFALRDFRWVVGKQDSLVDCLDTINALSAADVSQQCKQAQAYIQQYITAPSSSTTALFFPPPSASVERIQLLSS